MSFTSGDELSTQENSEGLGGDAKEGLFYIGGQHRRKGNECPMAL